MTSLLGIIGHPLGHSLSPVFQQAALDHLGIDATYEAWDTPPERLAERVRSLRATPYLGTNVTVPHKEAVARMVDRLHGPAERMGAVNTIVRRDGALHGYNTDVEGFLRSLREDGRFDPKGQCCVVLGAGGSARAVAYALATSGAASILILNRTLERAQELARSLQGSGTRVEAIETAVGARSPRPLVACALIVNCTSLGMKGGPAPNESPLAANQIPEGTLVVDLVYSPPVTPLLRQAKQAGAGALGGLPMLIYQGAASFALWTGRDAPVDVMFQAVRKALDA